MTAALLIWIVCAIVGGLIGGAKGRKGQGVALGGLLGLIGILILVCLPTRETA